MLSTLALSLVLTALQAPQASVQPTQAPPAPQPQSSMITPPPSPKKKERVPPPVPGPPPAPDPANLRGTSPLDYRMNLSADCVVNFQGELQRQSTLVQKGKPPVTIKGTQEFNLSIPGELQEWEAPNSGLIEFRFIPKANGEGASGSFASQETTIKAMQENVLTIRGTTVAGMSTWVIKASARGAELEAAPVPIAVRGQASGIKDASATGQESVPATVSPIRVLPPSKGQRPATPPMRFQGLSLWALKNAKSAFSVTAELNHDGSNEREQVRGRTKVSFAVTPRPVKR